MRLRPTIRVRLALWYAGTLLLCGGVLLGIAYVVVSQSIDTYNSDVAAEIRRASAAQAQRAVRAGRPPLPFEPPRVVSREERTARRVAEARARRKEEASIVSAFLASLGGLAVISAVLGWVIAGRALRPLTHVTVTARRVTERRLGERIALRGPRDELRELADTFDEMLARLERSFASQQRFVANASHELRTPLAVIRAELETTLADPGSDADELRRMGRVISDAVTRTEALISSLLALARSEVPLERTLPVDLAELAEAVLDDYRFTVERPDLHFHQELRSAPVRGDPTLLEGIVTNLIQNAVAYNRAGGAVHVETDCESERATLVVENDGELLREDELRSLFEPFWRPDDARTRGRGGAGLGLSIVKAAAEAHGGDVETRARAVGGLRVVVRLPSAGSAESLPMAPPAVAIST